MALALCIYTSLTPDSITSPDSFMADFRLSTVTTAFCITSSSSSLQFGLQAPTPVKGRERQRQTDREREKASLLRNRWLQFMLSNRYLDPSLQKAFMPTVPGCIEHQFKLSSLIAEAQSKHKSLAVCWLDLANAYGSVHHALIQFSLQHYYAPPQFLSILQALYSGLSATIISTNWETPLIPLEKGVYQGDPLSVVIFNTVITPLWTPSLLGAIWGTSFLGHLAGSISCSMRMTHVSWPTPLPLASTCCCGCLSG